MYKTLTQCPLFRGLTEEQIAGLIDQNTSVESYKAGEVLAKRESAYSGLMIILKGRVCGEFTYPSGKSLKMDTLEAPQLIAPAFLFGGYNRLPVDIVAETDVDILTLHRGLIFELMQENVLVLSNFIDIISNRANAWSKKIYLLSFKSLEEKFASYLLDSGEDVVAVPDVAQIAEFFAATRSSLQSVIEFLVRKNIIECADDKIRILNRKALQEVLK